MYFVFDQYMYAHILKDSSSASSYSYKQLYGGYTVASYCVYAVCTVVNEMLHEQLSYKLVSFSYALYIVTV